MSRRLILAALLVVLVAVPAMAGPRPGPNQLSFNLGYFTPRGEDARVAGDVLLADLGYFTFRMQDFNDASIGADYLYSLGDFFEIGAGISYYRGLVSSMYPDLTYEDGSDIVQDLKLKIVPITATVRFLPLSKNAPIEPYIGAGVAFLPWWYSETGDFVDYETDPPTIFRPEGGYRDSGTATGLVVLGGARAHVGTRYAIGGEIRYQKGNSAIGSDCSNDSQACFYGDKIDLGGLTYNFTFSARF
jgi:hypothetical protein